MSDNPYNDIEDCIRIGQIVKTLMQGFGGSKTIIRLPLQEAVRMILELEERLK